MERETEAQAEGIITPVRSPEKAVVGMEGFLRDRVQEQERSAKS